MVRGLRALEKHGVPFDLLFYVKHLRHAATLAARLPSLPLVIDHLAKPRIAEHVMEPWARDIERVAQNPRVDVKVSGSWDAANLKPYVDHVLHCFGPDRMMYGGGFEPNATPDGYVAARERLLAYVSHFSAADSPGTRLSS